MYCGSCGSPVREGVKFCGSCGAKAPRPRRKKIKRNVLTIAGASLVTLAVVIVAAMAIGQFGPFENRLKLDKDSVSDPVLLLLLKNYDEDGDGTLSGKEIESVSDIAIEGATDLSPINRLTSLEYLEVSGGALACLDCSKNQRLKSLSCKGISSLSSVVLGKNPELQSLVLDGTSVGSIDLSGVERLSSLVVDASTQVEGLRSEAIEETWVVESYTIFGDQGLSSAGGTREVSAAQTFDGMGRANGYTITETTVTSPSGSEGYKGSSSQSATYEYDGQGRVAGCSLNTSKGKKTCSYEYDDQGRLASVELSERTDPVAYTYDGSGNVVREKNNATDVYATYGEKEAFLSYAVSGRAYSFARWGYDGDGRLASLTTPRADAQAAGEVVFRELSYDGVGLCTGAKVSVSPVDDAKAGTVKDATASLTVEYSYDSAGNATEAKASNGSKAKVTYDEAGNLVKLETTVFDAGGTVGSTYAIELTYRRAFVEKGREPVSFLVAPSLTYDYLLFSEPSCSSVIPSVGDLACYADFDGRLPWNRVGVTTGAGSGNGGAASSELSVPDMSGMTIADAKAALVASGFVAVEGGEEHSASASKGAVCRQDPAAGQVAKKGSIVTLFASKGADTSAKKAEFQSRLNALKGKKYDSGSASYSAMAKSSQTMFEDYDALLNEVYQCLKETLTESEFASLREEESAWVSSRAAAMEKARDDLKAGSGYASAMEYYTKGASVTADRIQQLIDML